MVQTLGQRGDLQLKTLADLDVKEVIGRLRTSGEKGRQLRVLGNWNKLIKGIKAGMKTRSLQLCGKWLRFAKALLRKNEPTAQLNAIGRWGYLVEVLLKRQPIFKPSKVKASGGSVLDRWRVLLAELAFARGNQKLWLNPDQWLSQGSVERRLK